MACWKVMKHMQNLQKFQVMFRLGHIKAVKAIWPMGGSRPTGPGLVLVHGSTQVYKTIWKWCPNAADRVDMKRLALTSLAGCTELMLYLVHVSLFDAWKLVLHEHIPHGSACWVLIFASGTDARHAQSEWNPGTLDRELLHTFSTLGFQSWVGSGWFSWQQPAWFTCRSSSQQNHASQGA